METLLALIGVLLTALTTIPIIRELASGHQERATVSLAREVISGTCGDYEREYWTNAMNDALKKIEARQAYPTLRGIIALILYLVGFVVFVVGGWAISRSYASEMWIFTIVISAALGGLLVIVVGINNLSDMRFKRGKIYTVRYSEERERGLRMALFGPALYFFGLAVGIGQQGTQLILQLLGFGTISAGVAFVLIVSIRGMNSLTSDDRADQHLVPVKRPVPKPNPRTWETVRRYLVVLFILDLFTREKTG